jgi:hypothetical protein
MTPLAARPLLPAPPPSPWEARFSLSRMSGDVRRVHGAWIILPDTHVSRWVQDASGAARFCSHTYNYVLDEYILWNCESIYGDGITFYLTMLGRISNRFDPGNHDSRTWFDYLFIYFILSLLAVSLRLVRAFYHTRFCAGDRRGKAAMIQRNRNANWLWLDALASASCYVVPRSWLWEFPWTYYLFKHE